MSNEDVVLVDMPTFELIDFASLLVEPRPPEYLVENLIERGTLVVLYGESDSYKSFLTLDLGLHIAAGKDWHGRQVMQGPVVYLAGEGHAGLRRRLRAWTIKHQPSGPLPFLMSRTAADLILPEGAEAVVKAVNTVAEEHGDPLLIVVDTLDRNFGPGNENSTEDMRLFVAAVDNLKARFDCAMLIVHHVGHADKARERGAYALRASADVRYRVVRNSGSYRSVVSCEKMKDDEQPNPFEFSMGVVELGDQHPDGRAATSLVVEDRIEDVLANESESAETHRVQRPGANQLKVLHAIGWLMRIQRRNLLEDGRDASLARILLSDVREVTSLTRNRWQETLTSLQTKGYLKIDGLHVSLTAKGEVWAEDNAVASDRPDP